MELEVRLLGPVEVDANAGQLPVRGPIQRALVAMLALHANRVVASQELLRSMWGPVSTATRRSLQAHSRLRVLHGRATARTTTRSSGPGVRSRRGWPTVRP